MHPVTSETRFLRAYRIYQMALRNAVTEEIETALNEAPSRDLPDMPFKVALRVQALIAPDWGESAITSETGTLLDQVIDGMDRHYQNQKTQIKKEKEKTHESAN